MILERDENGFFGLVVTVHPLSSASRFIILSPVHRIYELGINRSFRSIWCLFGVFHTVVNIARNERIQLIRANDAYLMGLIAWWVSRTLHIPFCVSIHADYRKCFSLSPKGFFPAVFRYLAGTIPLFVLPRANMVLPIREHLRSSLLAAGADPSRIHVIPHGIDLTPFLVPLSTKPLETLSLPPDTSVISFVGRLSPDNYIIDMLSAIADVSACRQDVIFILVGEGSQAHLVHELISTLPDKTVVRLLPYQPYSTIVSLRRISIASLCLMGGFSLIEACAAGSTPITYDVDWHHELCIDGVTGHLLPEGDTNSLVMAIHRTLDDPHANAEMGSRARDLAFFNHELSVTSQIKRSCYQSLLDSSN